MLNRLAPLTAAAVLCACAPAKIDPEPGEVCLDVIGTVPEYCDPNVCVDDPIELVRPAPGDPVTALVEQDSSAGGVRLIGYLDAGGGGRDPRVAMSFGSSVKTDSSSANLLAELESFMIEANIPTRTRELSITSLPTEVEHAEVVGGELRIRGRTSLANLLYPSGVRDFDCSAAITPQAAQCNCVYERDVAEMHYELSFVWPY